MGITRLKRKNRKNKTVLRLRAQFLKKARSLELGSLSKEPKDSQVAKNNAVLAQLMIEKI